MNIDQVSSKAAQKLGFIRRNLRGAPADCKKLAYIHLIRSGMEYASIIWDPHSNADKLEKIKMASCEVGRFIILLDHQCNIATGEIET